MVDVLLLTWLVVIARLAEKGCLAALLSHFVYTHPKA
jgi:hypothetical protein